MAKRDITTASVGNSEIKSNLNLIIYILFITALSSLIALVVINYNVGKALSSSNEEGLAVDLTGEASGGTRECRDGRDNDGDTKMDWPADPGCFSRNDRSELNSNNVQCDNGIDDDRDGLVDYPDDPGCISPADVNELGAVQCDNSRDDDSDGFFDWPADSGCTSALDDSETDARCEDSDGGINTAIEGTVSGFYSSGQTYSFMDNCYIVGGSGAKGTRTLLNEWYCSSVYPSSTSIDCTSQGKVCLNGACV